MHTKLKLISLAALLLAALAPHAAAQDSDDYHRAEVSFGYSHLRAQSSEGVHVVSFGPGLTESIDPCTAAGLAFFGERGQRQLCERLGFNGFEASAVYNFRRYVGVKANFSAHFMSEDSQDGGTTGSLDARVYNFLAGLQVKDNRKESRAKPFAHALFGVARQTFRDVTVTQGAPAPFDRVTVTGSRNDFAMKLGGGLDLRVGRRVDLRLFEFNYNPVFGRESSLDVSLFPGSPTRTLGRTSHNFSVGIGVVFH